MGEFLDGAVAFLVAGIVIGFAPTWCEQVWRRSGGTLRIYAGRYTQVWGGALFTVGFVLLILWIANH